MIREGEGEQTFVVNLESARARGERSETDSPDAFFQAHSQAVYAYAMRRMGDRSAAEDITAEVFLEAVRHANRRERAVALPWLYGIARRKVADQLRLRSRRKSEALSEVIPATSKDPHHAAEESERRAELRRLVDSLPEEQREALLLHYVEGLPAEQVGIAMNKSSAAVNSLLQRARQNLRQKGEIELEISR